MLSLKLYISYYSTSYLVQMYEYPEIKIFPKKEHKSVKVLGGKSGEWLKRQSSYEIISLHRKVKISYQSRSCSYSELRLKSSFKKSPPDHGTL